MSAASARSSGGDRSGGYCCPFQDELMNALSHGCSHVELGGLCSTVVAKKTLPCSSFTSCFREQSFPELEDLMMLLANSFHRGKKKIFFF